MVSDFDPPATATTSCEPGTTRPCYEGLDGTEGVGPCRSGKQQCLWHGRSFGACDGQVVPAAEDCASPADENCDGVTSCGETRWGQRWGLDRDEVGRAVAVGGAESDIVFTGFYRDPIDFGGGQLSAVDNSRDIFVNKLDRAGQLLWSVGIAGDDHLVARDIAASADGEVAVVATVRGPIEDFGLGKITGAGGHDLFVVSLDSAGKARWAHRSGDGFHQYPMSVSFDSAGNMVVGGYFRGVMQWPSGQEEPHRFESSDLNDGFVMKLSPTGDLMWFRQLTGSADQYVRAVAVDEAGNVIVTGYFFREVEAGSELVTAIGDEADVFVVSFDAAGEHRYTRRFGGSSEERAYDVAVDSQGQAVIVGRFEGSMPLGGQLVDAAAAGAIFVLKVDASGDEVFGRRFGGDTEQGAHGVAVDSRDQIVVSGYYEGSPSFGTAALPAAGLREPNVALLKLDSEGNHVWSRGFDVVGDQDAGYANRGWRRVAIGAADEILLTGFVKGQLAFDTADPQTEPAGGSDIFLAAFAP